MNKIFSSIIIFLIGLISGYIFLILAGYVSWWTDSLLVAIANILKDYGMIYMLGVIDGLKNLILLIFAAIPVFLLSGWVLTYFFRNNIGIVKWISSIGILIFLIVFAAYPSLYNGRFFDAFAVLVVPLSINLFLIGKISEIERSSNNDNPTS
jgi:ABC-type dipeptide/oligopeptide/nickel transport system permease subunit